MRRYDDPVETRMGLVSGVEGPEQFLWRGRLWKVRAVIGSDEPGSGSTRSEGADLCSPDLLGERELWRVEAGRGRPMPDGEPDGGGVFDLAFDWADGRWTLVGCTD